MKNIKIFSDKIFTHFCHFDQETLSTQGKETLSLRTKPFFKISSALCEVVQFTILVTPFQTSENNSTNDRYSSRLAFSKITSVRTHVKSMVGTRLKIETSTFEIDKLWSNIC